MKFVLKVLTIFLAITTSSAINFPCEFTFDHINGYSCRVENFTNVNRHAHITNVSGNHLFQTDRGYRNRTEESVIRVTIWNATVHYLPGNLTEMFPHLKILHVKKCGMKSLTRSTEFHGLRKMFFGFNEIDRIPVNYFWHFCRLEILSLYGNRIHDIPKMAFRDLRSLSTLSLGSNLLRELHPNLFDSCTKLETIDLDHNFLEKIDSDLLSELPSLKGIYLRNNNLLSIGNDFLSTLPVNLTFVLFINNLCIKESFNKTATEPLNDFNHFKTIFVQDCSPPVVITTTTPRPTTTPPRKKPKHQAERIFYYEDCKWHAPPNHRYF
jgi:Leucine-rich repeat (LRR) protein